MNSLIYEDTEIITNPKGEYASIISLKSLKDVSYLKSGFVSYLESKRREYNSSVFKIHAGLKTIVCLDHCSAEYFFNAPRSILDRESQKRFGPLALRPEMIGKSCPALVSNGENHTKSRTINRRYT